MTTAILNRFLHDPEQVEYLYTQTDYHVALIQCADGKTRYCDVTLLTTLSRGPLEQVFQPVKSTDYVICNDSWSGHYDEHCGACWLGHSHNFDKHYQALCLQALHQQFNRDYWYDRSKEREMWEWEMQWWKDHVPFAYDEQRDRQTPRW